MPNQGYLPPPFRCADYLTHARRWGIGGGAVVSGSFQGFDQTYLLDALRLLGPTYVGVTQLPADCSPELITALHRGGVRAVRFNLYRGGSAGLDDVDELGRRVFEVAGWHSEFYLPGSDLPELEPLLAGLPQISIDHLALTGQGSDVLLRLVGNGAKVKASGFGRVHGDVPRLLRQLHRVNPDAMMFGTDLPGTRAPRAFRGDDITLLRDTLGQHGAAKALRDNAVALYRPAAPPAVDEE